MDDIYWITKWFVDIERRETTIRRLYYDKRTLGLNEFLWEHIPIEKIWIYDRPLDVPYEVRKKIFLSTLNYLYPFLREGKLKVKVMRDINTKEDIKKELARWVKEIWLKEYLQKSLWDSNWKWVTISWYEYGQEKVKKAIRDVVKRWLKCSNTDERRIFEMQQVLFTLWENEWEY